MATRASSRPRTPEIGYRTPILERDMQQNRLGGLRPVRCTHPNRNLHAKGQLCDGTTLRLGSPVVDRRVCRGAYTRARAEGTAPQAARENVQSAADARLARLVLGCSGLGPQYPRGTLRRTGVHTPNTESSAHSPGTQATRAAGARHSEEDRPQVTPAGSYPAVTRMRRPSRVSTVVHTAHSGSWKAPTTPL